MDNLQNSVELEPLASFKQEVPRVCTGNHVMGNSVPLITSSKDPITLVPLSRKMYVN